MSGLGSSFETKVLEVTAASSLEIGKVIQNLWSGYGKIVRVHLSGGAHSSVIVKHVAPPTAANHPRGWNTDISHQRKLRSYEVESFWYENWSHQCDTSIRIPEFLGGLREDGELLLILEDLDASGFPARLHSLTESQLKRCIAWLAGFHSRFLGAAPRDLWDVGTYWHLATRPDELSALEDEELKRAAPEIDRKLNEARFRTIVHGDAKVANFCFGLGGESVAMVDFQYVGGGCGMKDLAYFLGSCLDEVSCERKESELLDFYFAKFRDALAKFQPNEDPEPVEEEWRRLFPVAWTDFHRFLKGWSPGHWKLTGYSERLAKQVMQSIHET